MMSLLFDENGKPRAPVGPGSGAYTAAANFAESIGTSKERADAFAGGDRGARQEFMKLAVGQAFQQIRQWLGGEGRLAVAEFTRTLDEGSPNPNMQPAAIKSIIGFMQMLNQVKELEREEFGKFIDAQQGNGWKQLPRHWQPIWGDILKKSGIESRLAVAAKAASKAYKTGTP